MSLPNHFLDPPEPRIVDCSHCGDRGTDDDWSYLDGHYYCPACAADVAKDEEVP